MADTNNLAVEALNVAKAHKNGSNSGPVTLSTGVKAILKPVPSATIEEAVGKIKTPKVPITKMEDGRELENPSDPDYIQAIQEANRQRGMVSFDVMAALCVELVDPIPDDGQWEKRLKMLEKRGHLDLSSFDLADPIDREFVYIRFVALASDDWNLLAQISGVTQEAINRAVESFRG